MIKTDPNINSKGKILTIDNREFKILSKLGQGSFGSVYLIEVNDNNRKSNNRNKQNKYKRAGKLITNDPKKGIKSLHEIDMMNRLVHPNIVHSKGLVAEVTNNTVTELILMPIASTDLYDHARKPFNIFYPIQRLKALYDVTLGLNFMHRANYLHLDLKLENILLFGVSKASKLELQARLTDFGISLTMQENDSVFYPVPLFTIHYRPIEALEGNQIYTKASDIWSLGNIFFKVLSGGRSIFTEFTIDAVKNSIYNYFSPDVINSTLNQAFDNLTGVTKIHAVNLTRRMLSFNPADRPTTYEILNHPLFSQIKNINNTPILYKNGSLRVNTIRPIRPDIIYYYGFDYMVRLCISKNLKTETLFLAGDLYQRSLYYSSRLSGNFAKDWKGVVLMVSTCIYMAIKMCEKFIMDSVELSKNSNYQFTEFDVIKTEVFLVQSLNGILYPPNLFIGSLSLEQLQLGFTLLRNTFIYYKLNMNIWTDDNKRLIREGVNKPYNKHVLFSDFFNLTEYKKLMDTHVQHEYVELLYNEDNTGS